MKVDKNISIYGGNDVRVLRKQEEEKGKDSRNIFAGNLNLNNDTVLQKQQQAREKARKIINEAWDGDRSIDENLAERREKIRSLKEESMAEQNKLAELNQLAQELKETYGVKSDSQEQKDMDLLIKEKRSMKGGPALSEEEQERIAQIRKEGLTPYQERMLEIDGRGSACREKIEQNDREIQVENAIIRGIKLERLKTHPMLDAQNQADEIKKAASEEIIGMLIQEARDHIDEEMEKKEEEADKIREEKEEAEKVLERRREDREEQEELLEAITDGMLTLDQLKTDVQSEIQDVVNKMNLIAEDIKGSMVDKQL